MKFKKLGESRNSNERAFVALAYFIGASALFFLPSAIEVLSNTTFGGAGNILQYTQYNPYDVKNSMDLLIRTAGIIWFIRGCILLTHASEPGVQHGPKGLTFLFAGILAINFDNTVEFLNWLLGLITTFTLSVKTNQGY